MTPELVADLARAGESELVEFKRSSAETISAVQAVCAMLNHRGGRVLIGVAPKGQVLGQEVGARTIEDIAQRLREIEPPAFPSIDRVSVRGTREVIAITVGAGNSTPYTFRNRAYRRVGNTNEVMTRAAYDRLLLEKLHSEERWENQPAPDWTIEDLDEREIRLTVADAVRTSRLEDPGSLDPRDLLRGLGLLKDGVLLRAAVLLFGAEQRVAAEFPQCMLRIARFAGIDRTEFIDNRQVHGNAFRLLRSAETFLRDHNPIAGRLVAGAIERIDAPLYPPLAVREALANAICHRDYAIGGGSVAVGIYDDRLEVTSSGSLHFQLTPAMLFGPHESLPWNPLIARVFYRRGIIESWGRGTIRMVELAAAANLPRPEIEDAGGCVTVRFRPQRYVPPQLVQRPVTERQRTILAMLDDAPAGLPLREIVAKLDGETTTRQVRLDLNVLKMLDLAQSSGRGRAARWRRS